MRLLRSRTSDNDAPDDDHEEFLVLDDDEDVERSRGPIGSFFRLLTLPIRMVVFAVGLVVSLVLLPIRLGAAVIKRTIAVASDITYGLWRTVARIVGAVFGAVGFAIHMVTATVGGAIRLVARSARGLVRLLLSVFRLGRRTA